MSRANLSMFVPLLPVLFLTNAAFTFSPNPALPQTPGLPPSRSGRPYTTFELDQIRQMHRG